METNRLNEISLAEWKIKQRMQNGEESKVNYYCRCFSLRNQFPGCGEIFLKALINICLLSLIVLLYSQMKDLENLSEIAVHRRAPSPGEGTTYAYGKN